MDPNSGLPKWTFKTDKYIDSSPAVDNAGNVYFGSEDGKFYALDNLGELLWTYTTGGEIYSSPAVDNAGNVYFGSEDGKFYALDNLGELLWAYTTGDSIYSSPAMDNAGNVYFGSADGNFYALDNLGKFLWSYTTEGDAGDAAIGDGTLYFGNSNLASYYGTLVAIRDLKPDLVVENILAPSNIRSNEIITVLNTIKNEGTLAATNFYVKFYLTPTKSLSGTVYYLGQRLITILGPGESNTENTVLSIPLTVPTGAYYITALVDNFRMGYSNLIQVTGDSWGNNSGKSKSSVSAATVAMQPTGTPIIPLILGFLIVLGGLLTTRKK